MPEILIKSQKMSLLQRLFVFIPQSFFNRCFYLLCFINLNIRLVFRHGLKNTRSSKILSNYFNNFRITVSNPILIVIYWEQVLRILQMSLKYTLQKVQHSEKLLNYCLEALKRRLDIQKSYQKQLKELKLYTTRPLLLIYRVRYCAFFNLNPTL